MKMKKIIIGIIVLIVICGAYLVINNIVNKNNKEDISDAKKETYTILYQGKDIVLGTKLDAKSIGENYEVSEVTNCAFKEADKIYTYDDLEIVGATVNNEYIIYSVYFITDEVSTKEGVILGDDLNKILEVYGNNYEQPLDNKYVYTKNGVELAFIIENDYITSIEYTLLLEEE